MPISLPLVLFENAEMKFLNFQSQRTLPAGDLKAQPGTELRGIYAICTVTVEAAAAKAAGLTIAQQNALLEKMLIDLRYGAGKDFAHPFQDRPLSELQLIQMKAMETQVEGYGAGLGNGLSAAIDVGSNELSFIIELPLGHVESINENLLLGVGPEQVATFAIKMRLTGDPLNALDADLEATACYVRFAPDFRLAPEGDSGERLSKWGIIPILREFLEDTQPSVEVPAYLPIEVVDVANPNASNAFKGIRVEVGNIIVTEGDATPLDVESHYERQPDTGEIEAAVADFVTTMYRIPDRPLNLLPTGRVKITQEEQVTDFDLRAYYIPTMREWDYWAAMELHVSKLAERLGKQTIEAHFINPIAVHDTVKVEDRFLAALGWYACLPGDTEYATVPGLRFKPGQKEPKLHLPDMLLASKFGQWMTALSRRDKATMTVIEQSLARVVPTGTLGAGGFAAGESWVMQTIKFRLRSILEQTAPQMVAELDALAGD